MCIYTHVHPIIAVPSPRSPTTIATIIVSVVVMRTIFGVTVITIDIIGSTFGSKSWVCFSESGARFFQPRAFLPQNGVSLSYKGACFFQNRTCFSERAMTMTVPRRRRRTRRRRRRRHHCHHGHRRRCQSHRHHHVSLLSLRCGSHHHHHHHHHP